MGYQTGSPTALKRINDALLAQEGLIYTPWTISRICAFYLPIGYREEHEVRLDTERHSVTVRGEEIAMPLREFELLELLMRHSGRVLTRGQLIDRVWGSDYFGDTKTLDVHIKRIRSRIEQDPKEPKLVTTVRGVGYRFG